MHAVGSAWEEERALEEHACCCFASHSRVRLSASRVMCVVHPWTRSWCSRRQLWRRWTLRSVEIDITVRLHICLRHIHAPECRVRSTALSLCIDLTWAVGAWSLALTGRRHPRVAPGACVNSDTLNVVLMGARFSQAAHHSHGTTTEEARPAGGASLAETSELVPVPTLASTGGWPPSIPAVFSFQSQHEQVGTRASAHRRMDA
jgi:hypothetical protein